jgi:tellurite methyltransferase
MKSDQIRWDEKYRSGGPGRERDPNPFLKRHIRFLPVGLALDVACGEGANAVFLAQNGFLVEAVDISSVALRNARSLARSRGVEIKTIRADLDGFQLPAGRYEVVTVFNYLNRRLIPRIKRSLKRGGRIVYETYLREQRDLGGPKDPRYLLRPNELLTLFEGFRIRFYREGIFRERRKKAIAGLIAEKI